MSPSEGETFYASPETVFYSIYISGKIITTNPDPSKIIVRLEVFGEDAIGGTWTTYAQTDGSFTFAAMVNPEGPPSNDLLAFIHEECISCHFYSEIRLPRGRVMFRVTAIGSGEQASAERRIVVDRSEFITIPIRVIDADQADQPVPNVAISGATRLYLWRARYGSAMTDANGWAHVQVEALSQAPTRYLFRVKPTILDGVLYTGVAPSEIVIQPGQPPVEALTMRVRSQRGQIKGTLTGDQPVSVPVTIRAIDPQSGAVYSTRTVEGVFTFGNISIARYLVVVDQDEAAKQGLQSDPVMLDLTTPPSTQITTTLALREISNQSIRGRIRTADGEPLRFAWAMLDGSPVTTRVDFSTGEFVFYNPPINARVMRVIAPGYWSQSVAIATDVPLTVTLTPRSDTRHSPWGTGSIDVPSETVAEITDHRIILVNGWVWGNGSGKFEIQSANTTISLESAKFAIEQKPQQAWLYVSDGNAVVTFDANRPPITVGPGQMLALHNRTRAQPVPLDPVAIHELTRETTPPQLCPGVFIASASAGRARRGWDKRCSSDYVRHVLLCLGDNGCHSDMALEMASESPIRENHPAG